MIERHIDFARSRPMRCGYCNREWLAADDWSHRFKEQLVGCPTCGTTCENDNRPKYVAASDSPFLDDNYVREVYWYHTSVHASWPDRTFDPAETLDEFSKARLESQSRPGAVDRWIRRQKNKALHVGSYEAAIENMVRRIKNQGGSAEQFFLYRVVLDKSCSIAPGLNADQMGMVGDVELSELCSPPHNVYRYVNKFEDVSGISLALNIDAICKVKQIAIPLPLAESNEIVENFCEVIKQSIKKELPIDDNPASRIRARALTADARRKQYVTGVTNQLVTATAQSLPWSPGRDFSLSLGGTSRTDIVEFATRLVGMKMLIENSDDVLHELDHQPWKVVGNAE